MKKIVTLVLSLLTVMTVFGQSFEGKITYTNSFKSNNPQMTDEQWNTMMGTSQEFLIKGGDYKSTLNGTIVHWQLYLNKDNKLYSKMSNSEKAFWNDASIQGDEILKIEVNKGVTEILGYSCDEIILTCKSGIQKYYFNSKLAVDTKLYSNHKFGNWYDYLASSNSLPLKSIIVTTQFTMESTATEIKPMKLDTTIFELPVGMATEKSPY